MKLELLFKEVNEEPVKERRNVALSKRRLLNHSKGIDKDKYLILTNKDKYNTNTLFFPMTTYSYPTYYQNIFNCLPAQNIFKLYCAKKHKLKY